MERSWEATAKVQRRAAVFRRASRAHRILPRSQDHYLADMVPNPRYLRLNRVMTAGRGEGYDIRIKG